MQLRLLPAAADDLVSIAEYIARDNPSRAFDFIGELEKRCADLLDYPLSGRDRSEVAPGLRSKPHGRYVIFYSVSDTAVTVERILNAARDVDVMRGAHSSRAMDNS